MPTEDRSREMSTVKIWRETMRAAKAVASLRGMSLADYISEKLDPIIEAELTEMAADVAGLLRGEEPAETRKGGKRK